MPTRPAADSASLVLALTGNGKFRSLSTTVLSTVEEALDALGRAQALAAALGPRRSEEVM